ncbi:hypothetical protein CCACVL1_25834 [Corchorus capsularis]|uniref:Uncharacterized protein n=1 Tax=Corchorus capsularis TaxID=210143 RepID=A0A1R3GGU5_COCAP|nr:hypothetical protein CCACVL1_25834 [Corchorus capsularis]
MAEASRARVTITLGRSGQVVKRAGHSTDVGFSESLPVAGSKRSVRDRLGSNVDGSLSRGSQLNNKRQRGDGHATSSSANGMNEDAHISKHDLRYKLMQKNVFRRPQSDDNHKVMDLREKLERMPDPRERMPEPRERMPESREASMLGRIPSTRNADDLPRMTSSRGAYSPWTLDHLRQRSPDRVIGTSRGLSPPRAVEELQRRPLSRTYDDVRTVPYMGKDVLDGPRPVNTPPFVTKSTLPTSSAKPMPPGPPIPTPVPPPSSIVQKSSYPYKQSQNCTVLCYCHYALEV